MNIKFMVYYKYMKRVVLFLILFSLAFACFAVDEYSVGQTGSYEVNLEGIISEEDLWIQLVTAKDNMTVETITFDDLSPLNDVGYMVSSDIYSLVYSYVKPETLSPPSVRLVVSSEGLTMDGGTSYPISISFVDPESDSSYRTWETKSLVVNGTADYVEYENFRIRLDNAGFAEVAAGNYSGTISFMLESV